MSGSDPWVACVRPCRSAGIARCRSRTAARTTVGRLHDPVGRAQHVRRTAWQAVGHGIVPTEVHDTPLEDRLRGRAKDASSCRSCMRSKRYGIGSGLPTGPTSPACRRASWAREPPGSVCRQRSAESPASASRATVRPAKPGAGTTPRVRFVTWGSPPGGRPSQSTLLRRRPESPSQRHLLKPAPFRTVASRRLHAFSAAGSL